MPSSLNRSIIPAAVLAIVLACSQADSGGGAAASPTQPQVASEGGGVTNESETIVLSLGEEATVGDLSLRWAELEEDSRCPQGVECIWEGRVVILLEVTVGSGGPEDVRLTDHPDGLREDERTPGDLAERLRLVDVEPYPRSDSPIEPSDYRATIELRGA